MGYSFRLKSKGSFICIIPRPILYTDRITHTTAFVTPVVEPWLGREIAQWIHSMKDRPDDPSHHNRTLLPRSYISLPRSIIFRVRLCDVLYLRYASEFAVSSGVKRRISQSHRQYPVSPSNRPLILPSSRWRRRVLLRNIRLSWLYPGRRATTFRIFIDESHTICTFRE